MVISELSTEDLLRLMNEIYDYERSTKKFDEFPKLKELFENNNFHDEHVMIESYIIHEAQRRFNKVVPTLLKKYMDEYLK